MARVALGMTGAALLWSLCISVTEAAPLTIANFGGANGDAQVVAFQKPFALYRKTDVVAVEYNGDLAPIRDMVANRKVKWDVVEVESTDLLSGCAEGVFENISPSDLSQLNMLLPGSVSPCGVGAFVWSTVLAYDARRLKSGPRQWSDFWNVRKFPGMRGMRKGPRYNLEFALMADGVMRSEVYQVLGSKDGLERALKKLVELQPYIVWWQSGAQPPKMLASGEVVMSTAFNGRIAVANHGDAASDLEIAWTDAIYELDYWVIPKGSPHLQLAKQYIDYATTEQAQLAFSREIPYGPINFEAILKFDTGRHTPANSTQSLIDMSMVSSDLPSAPGNMRKSLAFDAQFWMKHGPAIEKRFNEVMRLN